MKAEIKNIETGAILMARSICDSECIFTATVIERKKSFVTVKADGAEAIIKREYFNYETQLSGDLDDMIDALSSYVDQFHELFTNEVIKKVSDECFQDAVNNDWF